MSFDPTQIVYTIKQASEVLQMPFNTCRAHVYAGRLRSVRIGKRGRRIRRDDLLAFVGMTAADLAPLAKVG